MILSIHFPSAFSFIHSIKSLLQTPKTAHASSVCVDHDGWGRWMLQFKIAINRQPPAPRNPKQMSADSFPTAAGHFLSAHPGCRNTDSPCKLPLLNPSRHLIAQPFSRQQVAGRSLACHSLVAMPTLAPFAIAYYRLRFAFRESLRVRFALLYSRDLHI